jgi:hypothetical protein
MDNAASEPNEIIEYVWMLGVPLPAQRRMSTVAQEACDGHGPRLCTVVDGDVVVTEACPHRHARHGIQTKVRSPFPMWPGAVRHKQPPFLTL